MSDSVIFNAATSSDYFVRNKAIITTKSPTNANANQHHFGWEYWVTKPPIMQPTAPPKPVETYISATKS